MHSFYEAQVVSQELIGEHVRYVIIKPSEALEYEPGQFFILRLRDEKGEYVERSYSVANFDDSGQIEFVIRIEENGRMSQLIDKMEKGQAIDIKGPFGRFGFIDLPKDMTKLVLIAGGVGISPIRSMIQKSFGEAHEYPLQLFYGFRTPKDFLFQQELEMLTADERFEIFPAISEKTDLPWTGFRGFISDALEGNVFEPQAGVHCCICGPPPMVKATREKLFELGFERSHVHVEAW